MSVAYKKIIACSCRFHWHFLSFSLLVLVGLIGCDYFCRCVEKKLHGCRLMFCNRVIEMMSIARIVFANRRRVVLVALRLQAGI